MSNIKLRWELMNIHFNKLLLQNENITKIEEFALAKVKTITWRILQEFQGNLVQEENIVCSYSYKEMSD